MEILKMQTYCPFVTETNFIRNDEKRDSVDMEDTKLQRGIMTVVLSEATLQNLFVDATIFSNLLID